MTALHLFKSVQSQDVNAILFHPHVWNALRAFYPHLHVCVFHLTFTLKFIFDRDVCWSQRMSLK